MNGTSQWKCKDPYNGSLDCRSWLHLHSFIYLQLEYWVRGNLYGSNYIGAIGNLFFDRFLLIRLCFVSIKTLKLRWFYLPVFDSMYDSNASVSSRKTKIPRDFAQKRRKIHFPINFALNSSLFFTVKYGMVVILEKKNSHFFWNFRNKLLARLIYI